MCYNFVMGYAQNLKGKVMLMNRIWKRNIFRTFIGALLTFNMVLGSIGGDIAPYINSLTKAWADDNDGGNEAGSNTEQTESNVFVGDYFTLSDPVIEEDNSLQSGHKVTWDCISFGSYPQAEVVDDYKTYDGIIRDNTREADNISDDPNCSDKIREEDVIEDSDLYSRLEAETEWDDNNDVVIDGNKYHRACKGDAVLSYDRYIDGQYYWNNDKSTYHYFKYQPITWRVLEIDDDNTAIVMADKAVDCKKFNNDDNGVTWENCTIRTWLNEYFYETAFDKNEKDSILLSNVVNGDNVQDDIYSGNNTDDYIYLLSSREVCDAA